MHTYNTQIGVDNTNAFGATRRAPLAQQRTWVIVAFKHGRHFTELVLTTRKDDHLLRDGNSGKNRSQQTRLVIILDVPIACTCGINVERESVKTKHTDRIAHVIRTLDEPPPTQPRRRVRPFPCMLPYVS